MNANNSTIQNQELYEGIKQVMLQDGVIPEEIIKYNKEMQEKKRLEEIQKKFEDLASPINNITQSIESAIKKYPILTPIKIIVKRVDGMLEIIDLILEYQINGEEGVIIKIGGKIIETIIFEAGVEIAVAISVTVAGFLLHQQ